MRTEKALQDVIRKELTSDVNRRFLNRMSTFKPDAELPERMRSLLGELDAAENRGHGRRRA